MKICLVRQIWLTINWCASPSPDWWAYWPQTSKLVQTWLGCLWIVFHFASLDSVHLAALCLKLARNSNIYILPWCDWLAWMSKKLDHQTSSDFTLNVFYLLLGMHWISISYHSHKYKHKLLSMKVIIRKLVVEWFIHAHW